MTEAEALKIAEPIVKQVVDLIAKRQYSGIEKIAAMDVLSPDDLEDLVEDFLKLNELTHIDAFDAPVRPSPNPCYHQFNAYVYTNGSGFAIDYDLTTDSEPNDLTLQMEFLFTENGIRAYIQDCHVL